MEVNVERLLGAMVRDIDGEDVGRIEELRVERQDNFCVVEAYLIGTSGLIHRLSAWTLVRPIRKFLSARNVHSAYRVPWQEMDLSEPHHPRLRIARRDLRHAK
jgi:sporulation protein YlmC with PRC-barrel domain